jgi:hypothetical protein
VGVERGEGAIYYYVQVIYSERKAVSIESHPIMRYAAYRVHFSASGCTSVCACRLVHGMWMLYARMDRESYVNKLCLENLCVVQ